MRQNLTKLSMIKNSWAKIIVTAAITCIPLGLPLTVRAASVLPPNAVVAGKTLYEWSADWWKTFLDAPLADNPLVFEDADGTSLEAINGLSSPVFFLTGTVTGDSFNRKVTVSDRQAIFFPLLNEIFIGTEPNDTAETLCADTVTAADQIDTTSMFATLDGGNISDLGSQRQSCDSQPNKGVFSLESPTESLLNAGVGLPPGLYPSTSDGYWLMFAPLSLGEHTITFGGVSASGNQQNQTYTIEVIRTPEPISSLGLLAFGTLGAISVRKGRTNS
jgi:hypothetical protein